MLRIFTGRHRDCGGISRRSFLEVGLSVLGLSLADVLRLRAAGSQQQAAANSGKSLIVFWTGGGISQQDTYDMKPDAPSEYRGPYRPISTSVPGIQITERCPRQARVMHKFSIVRSVNHQNSIHSPSCHWMQTGYFGPTTARNAPQKPSIGSVIARARSAHQPNMPAYVAIPKAETGYQGAVYLGAAYNPFEVGADPSATDFRMPNLALPKGLTLASVQNRGKLYHELDTLRRDIDRSGALEGFDTFKAQALEMVTGDRVRKAFELTQEKPRLRDRYGRNKYGQSALLARRLVEAGSTCVTINVGAWDHHSEVEKNLNKELPPFDAAFATLIEDLDERGMLDDVLIYSMGEFGRTPLVNSNAGRDHWSNCFSVLLGGGGLKGGQTVGESELRGGKVRARPISPNDLCATLYQVLGIPQDTHYLDASGRPVSIVGPGKPIHELL